MSLQKSPLPAIVQTSTVFTIYLALNSNSPLRNDAVGFERPPSDADATKGFSMMIIDTKVRTCRKCHSKEIVKNGKNGYGNPQYHCKTCGAYGVLEPRERYTEEEKELIIKAYQEGSSMRGIERTHGVCRHTLSAWLKKSGTATTP